MFVYADINKKNCSKNSSKGCQCHVGAQWAISNNLSEIRICQYFNPSMIRDGHITTLECQELSKSYWRTPDNIRFFNASEKWTHGMEKKSCWRKIDHYQFTKLILVSSAKTIPWQLTRKKYMYRYTYRNALCLHVGDRTSIQSACVLEFDALRACLYCMCIV